MSDTNTPITVQNGRLVLPHMGITLRGMMGAAINNLDKLTHTAPRHLVPVYYAGARIATLSLGQDFRE